MVTLRMEQIYHPFAYMLWITCSCKFVIDFTSSLAFMVQFSFVKHRDHSIALFLPSEHCLFLFPVTISSFSADLYLPNSFMTIPLREKLLWAISQLARELSHETSCHITHDEFSSRQSQADILESKERHPSYSESDRRILI